MRGKKGHIHRAQRMQTSESDLVDKFNVIQILREEFNLYGLTGEFIQINNESYRLPDILIKGKTPIIIELDGLAHGEPEIPNKKTRKRNDDYSTTKVKTIIINKEVTKGYRKDLVIAQLRADLPKL